MGRWYILEGLSYRCFRKACRITHYLGCLTTGSVSEWPEVRHIVYTWLTRSSTYVTRHMASAGKTLYPLIEGVRWGHVLESLAAYSLGKARSITHHLCQLPACYLVIGAEGPV